MEIWKWVEKLQDDLAEAGQAHSAQLIDQLSTHVAELEVERAEALLPELKALSKTLNNPWLEVFVGHWEMRNRVGNRFEGEQALADAVSLFETAHRADTIECPQSVCVTQDLAACYANIDGPGWVAERIEVCDETIARIDPSWTCFQCISIEKAEALLDSGDGEAALAYLTEQENAILDAGHEVFDSIYNMQATVLNSMGRGAEGLAIIEEIESRLDGPQWNNTEQSRTLEKMYSLAILGRDEEAWALFIPLEDVSARYRAIWIDAVYLLVQREPARNTWQFGRNLQQHLLEHFSQVGAHRLVIETGEKCVRLALQRGSSWSAQRYLNIVEKHLGKLRQDLGATGLVAVLRSAVQAATVEQSMPAPADELLAWLAAQDSETTPRSPEKEVQWLLQAVAERPEDAELREVCVSALQACSAVDQAIALLWEHVERHADAEDQLAYYLLNILLAQNEYTQIERLSRLYRDSVPLTAAWCLAKMAEKRADWALLESICQGALRLSPDSNGVLALLAQALMQQRRFSEAATCYKQLSEQADNPQPVLWDHMTAASAAQDWPAVRASAASLGMELSSEEGVIEENWGWVKIRFVENGEALDYFARRTGPVTARISEHVFGSNRAQHIDDWVVFDAGMLYPPPEDEAEREHFRATYASVQVLEKGGFGPSWLIDGVDPGETAIDALQAAVTQRGWSMWVHSAGDYRVIDSHAADDTELPGIYFSIALPESVPAIELQRLLQETTATWEHQLCWLRLAEKCAADTQVHRDVIERYGL